MRSILLDCPHLAYQTLRSADLRGKRVLLRAGFDVPMEQGQVTDDTRIRALLPTMRHILDAGASLIIMSHQGRPKGQRVAALSQKPLQPILPELLSTTVQFTESCVGPEVVNAARALKQGEVLLLENLRFDARENSKNADERAAFAKELAALADAYVNDAFPNCHRDHASMTGVPALLPAYMGLQLQEEVEKLTAALRKPTRPLVLVIGGAKMETKVPVIEHFLGKGDDVLLGGGIANTFLLARGYDIGVSLHEEAFIEIARRIMLESEGEGRAQIHVPADVVVASEPKEDTPILDIPVEDTEGDMKIFDVGRKTIDQYIALLAQAKTIIWNGPLGFHELDIFATGSRRIAEAVAAATKRGAQTILGGGDTLDLIDRMGLQHNRFTFVSTGGGAMLEFIAGKELPALRALQAINSKH